MENNRNLNTELFKYIKKEENTWFQPNISYKGRGKLKVNGGVIEGTTEVTFDENGRQNIEMIIEAVHSEEIESRLLEKALVSGHFSEEQKDGQTLHTVHWTPSFNKCQELVVETQEGTFSSGEETRISGYQSNMNLEADSSGSRLKIFSTKSVFEPHVSETADNTQCHWVLPLSNFLSDYQYRVDHLNTHPLRLERVTIAPSEREFSQEDKDDLRLFYLNSFRRVIPFNFNNFGGYIESLLDYESRKDSLERGSARRMITSVMVGDAMKLPSETDEILEWVPFFFLSVLSLSKESVRCFV